MMSSKPLSAIPGVPAVSVCPSCGAKESPRRQYWRANKPELRKPRILSWDEQSQLLEALPTHLQGIVLFMLNTGCREPEICQLQWKEERILPGLKASVFKHGSPGFERWVILNDVAQAILEAQRGLHANHVFSHNAAPLTRINRLAWKRALQAAGIPELRIYDLRCTFEQRLKGAGVSLQDRRALLGRLDIDDSNESWGRWITITNKVCRPVKQEMRML